MNDDQSDIRRSVSMSHGLLMASSPEQVGRKRSRREQTGRPGHRRIHSEPVHVAAPTDDVDLFPMWSLADDPIMALDVEPSTPEWARVMEHCATSFGGGGGDSPGLGLGRKKGHFGGDLPGAFYGDDDEDLGATRRNASHSLDAATSSVDPNSSLDLPNSSYGEDDSLCDGLSPMTTEAFRKAILPAIARDDKAAAARPPRAAAPRRAPAGKSGKGKGAKGDDAKGDGDKDRGRYKCGRCGQVKVNHVCPFGTATNRNVDAQCEDPERPIRVGDEDGVVGVSELEASPPARFLWSPAPAAPAPAIAATPAKPASETQGLAALVGGANVMFVNHGDPKMEYYVAKLAPDPWLTLDADRVTASCFDERGEPLRLRAGERVLRGYFYSLRCPFDRLYELHDPAYASTVSAAARKPKYAGWPEVLFRESMILHRGFRMTPTAAPTRSPTKKLWQRPWYTLGAADRDAALRALADGSRRI